MRRWSFRCPDAPPRRALLPFGSRAQACRASRPQVLPAPCPCARSLPAAPLPAAFPAGARPRAIPGDARRQRPPGNRRQRPPSPGGNGRLKSGGKGRRASGPQKGRADSPCRAARQLPGGTGRTPDRASLAPRLSAGGYAPPPLRCDPPPEAAATVCEVCEVCRSSI